MDTTPTDEERERALARHMEMKLDLGHGVRAEFTGLYGDQENTRTGLFISHMHEDGMDCIGSVTFDLPVMREKFPNGPLWTLHSLDPLTLSPSVLNSPCGLHGFIREGKWVPA